MNIFESLPISQLGEEKAQAANSLQLGAFKKENTMRIKLTRRMSDALSSLAKNRLVYFFILFFSSIACSNDPKPKQSNTKIETQKLSQNTERTEIASNLQSTTQQGERHNSEDLNALPTNEKAKKSEVVAVNVKNSKCGAALEGKIQSAESDLQEKVQETELEPESAGSCKN